MKRPNLEVIATKGDTGPFEPCQSLEAWPTLNEFLCNPAWEDLSLKGQRCAFIFLEGTIAKILLKVEHPPLKVMISARGLDDALLAAEAVLLSGQVPWEQDTPREQGQSKKRK